MQQRLQEVNVHQVREKIGNKKELYNFLTQECGAYLPKLTCSNVYFFKAILYGEKEYLKRTDVVINAVPQIEGLTAEDLLDYAKQKPSLLIYLPDQSDQLHLDKKWICDVLLSFDKDGVNQMIYEAKLKRKKRLDQTQNLIEHMKPEFAQALQSSISYNVQKGRSAHLIKQSSQVKGEEFALKGSKQKYLKENKRMRDEFKDMRGQIDDLINYKQQVHTLHKSGVIDDGGRLLNEQQNQDMN